MAAIAIEHQAELHSNDADFARFPGLRHFNPLPKLTVRVQNTTLLQDLSGLEGIAEVDDLRLANNAGLTSLSGLSGARALVMVDTLTSGTVGHIIENNPQLVSLDGLSSLESADFVILQNNAGLERLGTFPNLHSLGRLVILGNPKLTSLAGMTALNDNEHLSLEISENATLTNLSGFDGVKHLATVQMRNNAAMHDLTGWHFEILDEGLLISGNPELETLNGLESLQRASNLQIESNPKLTSLDGLSGLRTVDLWILLLDNPSLVSLRAVGGVTSTGSRWTIQGNSQLPQCEIQQLALNVPGAEPENPTGNGPPGVCTSW